MTKFSMSAFPRSALAGAALIIAGAGLSPAQAQEGLVMRHIFGKIGILPEEKDPIEYRERPALVVPKDIGKLRQPEKPEQHTRNSQWPVDPDVVEREKERRRKAAAVIFPLKSDPSEGGRLSIKEMAAGRSQRGEKLGEAPVPANDKAGVRLSVWEMKKAGEVASAPSYPPGTEPPRKYLTDPPTGLRIPASTAPIGRRTQEAPRVENDKDLGAWKRLE